LAARFPSVAAEDGSERSEQDPGILGPGGGEVAGGPIRIDGIDVPASRGKWGSRRHRTRTARERPDVVP